MVKPFPTLIHKFIGVQRGSHMKRRKYLPIFYSIVIILIIFSFHTCQNLKHITSSPSDKWARELYIDKSPYKKTVSMEMNEEDIVILTAKEDRFSKTVLEKDKARIKETEDIIIPDAALNKLVKYQSMEPYIFWTENYELYASKSINGNTYEEKSLILDKVKDFEALSHEDNIYLAVADETGLRYYMIDDKGVHQFGETYAFEEPVCVSAAIDDAGILHTVSIREISPMEKEIIYLNFLKGEWSLKAQKVENFQISNESIGNLEIGLDNDYAYIFYENNVWNKAGQTAKTQYAAVPLNEAYVSEMGFKPFKPLGRESQTDVYISEVRCPDKKQDELMAVFIENHHDETGSGFRILNAYFRDGIISNQLYSTKTLDFIKGINIVKHGEDEALVFLRAAGEFKYDVFFTEIGEEYAAIMEKPTKQDYFIAMANSISPFINGFIIAIIKAFVFIPAILWLVFVEVFEIKKFVRNPKLNYSMAIGLFMIIKLITANSYYTGLSYYMIPNFMQPPFIKYMIMVCISVISYLMAKAWKKSIEYLHVIPEFLLFMLYDLLITVFLYGPYIT